MDVSQLLVAILATSGGGAALIALVNGLIKWVSGASAREKKRNTDFISQRRDAILERDEAYAERDKEASTRRKADEYSSMLRRMLIENGITPPPWYNENDGETEKEIKSGRRD